MMRPRLADEGQQRIMEAVSVTPAEAPHASRRYRILIVEDEVLIRIMIGEELRDVGYEVLEACNADEAAAILDTGLRCDLIISDVRMPGSMDGLGLLAYVRACHPTLPVIIASGHLPRIKAEACGATGFLAKPFAIDIVLVAVAHALERPHE